MSFNKKIYWWYSPYKLIGGVILPIFIFLCFYPFNDIVVEGIYDGGYYINSLSIILGTLFLSLIILSSFITIRLKKANSLIRSTGRNIVIKSKYLDLLALLTIIGYIIWFNWLFTNPQILIGILLGEGSYSVRNTYETIPGLTTLAQLGVLYTCIFYYEFRQGKEWGYRYKIYFYIVAIFILVRTVLWSERLAFVELVVPIGLIFISTYRPQKILIRKLMDWLPYIGVIGIFIFFGVFEYFRSWQTYSHLYDSYWSFTVDRLGLYYFTAINNGAAVLTETEWPSYSFEAYFNWFYEFPIIGSYMETLKPPESYGDWHSFLNTYLDPEFNNSSGILDVYNNSGIIGASLFAILVGIFGGITFLQFSNNRGLGKYIFPLFFIYFMDIIRIPYITSTRTFPIFIFAILGYYYFRKKIVIKKYILLKKNES